MLSHPRPVSAASCTEQCAEALGSGFGTFENIWEGYKQEMHAADVETRDMLGEHMGDDLLDEQWKDFDGLGHDFDGMRTFSSDRGPENGHYLFEEENLFQNVPNAFEEGLKIMNEGGNLSLAALAFEAAVQKQPDHVEAWVALGSAQAQNEKESPAIRAMEQALKLDPGNLDALMGLSVSYTNEGYDSLAYRTLERWVSTKYPSLATSGNLGPSEGEMEEELGFTDRHILHEKVTNLFLEAAQLNPDGADLDVDVQVGLGVLFYGSEDYEKAVDCFSAALGSSQTGSLKRSGEEHLLWNRLGATLANSGRSEEVRVCLRLRCCARRRMTAEQPPAQIIYAQLLETPTDRFLGHRSIFPRSGTPSELRSRSI